MARFIDTVRNAFKIEELKQRLIFTGLMLLVVRVGSFIAVPGIDVAAIDQANVAGDANTLFGFFNQFVGGAYSNASIFSLGIMPYISASIIIQLMTAVVPFFQKLQQEGEQGRVQINTITRYITVALAFAQGIAIAISIQNIDAGGGVPVVPVSLQGPLFILTAAFIMTAGTIFLMWIGEQITERGIGNGVSLIIFIGIVARLPIAIQHEFALASTSPGRVVIEIVIVAMLLAVIAAVVLFTQAMRKIPVQYAKRQVGNKSYSTPTQYLPISLVTANVMPIIFAQTLMFLPQLLGQTFAGTGFGDYINTHFQHQGMIYSVVLAVMIIFFTFFYTAIVFSPKDVAERLRKNGGYIPGIRPGKPTEEYIDNILTKITVPGSLFLALVAILPAFVLSLGVSGEFSAFFGGTSLLIIVGVALDTLKQIESYLLMRHYDGFMKSGKLRGRQASGQIPG